MSRRATIWLSVLLAGAVIAFAAYRAPRLAWLADDSFISFRYAWNLVHGHGLVYNAGGARSVYEFLGRYSFQTAGPEKKALADELREAVNARRPGKTGA